MENSNPRCQPENGHNPIFTSIFVMEYNKRELLIMRGEAFTVY